MDLEAVKRRIGEAKGMAQGSTLMPATKQMLKDLANDLEAILGGIAPAPAATESAPELAPGEEFDIIVKAGELYRRTEKESEKEIIKAVIVLAEKSVQSVKKFKDRAINAQTLRESMADKTREELLSDLSEVLTYVADISRNAQNYEGAREELQIALDADDGDVDENTINLLEDKEFELGGQLIASVKALNEGPENKADSIREEGVVTRITDTGTTEEDDNDRQGGSE